MSLRSPQRRRRRRVPALGAHIYGDLNIITIVEVCRMPDDTHPDQTPVLVRALE
jgi:hypothetical protein